MSYYKGACYKGAITTGHIFKIVIPFTNLKVFRPHATLKFVFKFAKRLRKSHDNRKCCTESSVIFF